jgi:hypothetical protein
MQSWIFHPLFHIDLTFRQCSVISSLSLYLPLLSAKNYKDYEEQDKKLELHLDILNEEIRKVNDSGDRSPRFMQDLWRGSKGHNPRSHTKTYTDQAHSEKQHQP